MELENRRSSAVDAIIKPAVLLRTLFKPLAAPYPLACSTVIDHYEDSVETEERELLVRLGKRFVNIIRQRLENPTLKLLGPFEVQTSPFQCLNTSSDFRAEGPSSIM